MPRPEPIGFVKLKSMLTGDDLWATIMDEDGPYKNQKTGMWMKRYLIIPSDLMLTRYPELMKPGIMNIRTPRGMAKWIEYPNVWIVDENASRVNSIARVLCTFDGRETAHTRRHQSLTDEILRLEEENEGLKISNIQLTEEVNMILKEKLEMIKTLNEMHSLVKGEKPSISLQPMEPPHL